MIGQQEGNAAGKQWNFISSGGGGPEEKVDAQIHLIMIIRRKQ